MIVIPSTTDVRSVDITMCRANWLDDDPLLAHLDEPVPDPATRAWIAALSDASARRREFAFCPPACLRPALRNMLADTRDEPLLYLLVNVLLTTVPAAVAVFWLCAKVSTPWGHCLGAVYLTANYVTFLQRFLLGLHCSAHRPLFRSAYSSLNGVMPYMIAPLFGIPAGMYQLHHCIMHHVEGNVAPRDLSSTERYQRDSFPQFLCYWVRHSLGSWVELPLYALRKKRFSIAAGCLAAEAAYTGAAYCLWRANPVATLWVLVLPFFISSFAMMFGNWSQHIFINPSAPQSPAGMTYSCVNHPDNQFSFNDGYHVQHHCNSRLHWTLLPERFIETLPQHAASDALVFEGVGWFDVGLAVFTGRYKFLVDKFVPYSKRFAALSPEEVIQLLKSRLQPIKQF